MTKKRKRTSKVWDDFKEITDVKGNVKAECIHCKTRLSVNKTGCTTHLARHSAKCTAKQIHSTKGQQNISITMSMAQKEAVSSVTNFKYDHSKIRDVLSHMIIVHELPFRFPEYELFNLLMKSATPLYNKISRATTKKDCWASYELEKKRLMNELKSVSRVSVTTDLWTSDQNISYMVVTGHYVDSNWNLQKRTLNFCDIPPPHTGVVISDVLQRCFREWGIEEKVWTITVDNASNNDVAIRILKENLLFRHTLPLGGQIFHVRCCAHILNLLVKDGLSSIQDVISKVRESVKYVAASEAHVIMFGEIAKQLELSSKKLVLDCVTRWNATYFMLSCALEFKVFPRYQQRDPSYTTLPSEEEWEKVRIVCSFLEDFHEITVLISCSEYPTANLFLVKLVHIKSLLTYESLDKDSAAVLDPRNKMKYIEWCADNCYSGVEGIELKVTVFETLRNLYAEYVEAYRVSTSTTNIVRNASDAQTGSSSNVSGVSSVKSVGL
ncbi:zinc finger BED domain-containing protein RICESLEEPER 2-like [Salvia miltiorrhiza]|uniref:zinc finger BED domain-containing protein RICESLEEPER 2-like n=1 Tax=Salvia miltiorrhiza TaxID=226208 RepID=UPI0025ACC7D0|nr:zinc finger BED domain-containing protein RICESLEEPER 2-like [Salvia miltiorrhiza]